jgi:hypothetical protein
MSTNSTLYILVIVLVFSFIFLSLTPCKGYAPYDNQTQTYATYEPMTQMPENSDKEDEKKKENEGSELNHADKTEQKENFESVIDVPRTIHYGPFRDSEVIDKFSQITTNGMDGVNGCVSSGLSNSGGYICLSHELIQLLKTRGGNAAGGECLSK